MSTTPQDVQDLVVGNGDRGTIVSAETAGIMNRLLLADGVQRPALEILERHESLMEGYAAKLQDRIANSVQKVAMENGGAAPLGTEEGGARSGSYKWWDVYATGPVQNITLPAYWPHKIFAGGELVYFYIYVVTNPLPLSLGPSAMTILSGRPYSLRLETLNLTNVSAGPVASGTFTFPGTTSVQSFLGVMSFPTPAEGRPEVIEFNITADINDGTGQPMAAFATSIMDIDFDPGFPYGTPSGPHIHQERPLRALCYHR